MKGIHHKPVFFFFKDVVMDISDERLTYSNLKGQRIAITKEVMACIDLTLTFEKKNCGGSVWETFLELHTQGHKNIAADTKAGFH